MWWDIVVAGVLAMLAGVGIAESGEPGHGPVVLALAPLVAFAALYVLLGREVLLRAHTTEERKRIDAVYIALGIAVLGVAAAIEPSYATLQSLLFPMVWVTTPARQAVLWSAALAATVGAGSTISYLRLGSEYAVWTALFVALLSFGFAVAMGTWITRIHAAGERHRELAEELRRSQARTAALAAEQGASAERERLSRDLHDTLTQTLAGLVMLTEQAERAIAADDVPRARDRIERVGSAARDAVAEARALVATTQPLGEGGLEGAIERICARFASDTGVAIACRIQPLGLDRERQVVFLRAAQEGLANARRHAGASSVEVTLGHGPDGGALLRVDDDGRGPQAHRATAPIEQASPAGFGLSGLGDRVRAVGGAVEFGPRPGGGARLEVRLPAGTEER